MRALRSARGFTLIELLTALAIGSVVMAGVTGMLIAQARQFHQHASRRNAQASARQAISFVQDTLRMASYGVDPALAVFAYDGFYPQSPTSRDFAFADAVTVHFRDPDFRRSVASVSGNSIEFPAAEPLKEPMLPGQILLGLCPGATTYTYFTVADRAEAGEATVSIAAIDGGPDEEGPLGAPSDLFHKAPASCLADPGAWVTRIERRSFFVDAFDDDGDPNTADVPYLMLHRGLDLNGDGNINVDDAVPLGTGVEQFQLAYVLNSAPGTAPLILGVDETNVPGWGSKWAHAVDSVKGPAFEDTYTDPLRYVAHPANIRQIRVTLVSRGYSRDEGYAGDNLLNPADATLEEKLNGGSVAWARMENLKDTVAVPYRPEGGGFHRTIARVAVTPKNFLMRGQFLPLMAGGG